jgi:hypothetical protein
MLYNQTPTITHQPSIHQAHKLSLTWNGSSFVTKHVVICWNICTQRGWHDQGGTAAVSSTPAVILTKHPHPATLRNKLTRSQRHVRIRKGREYACAQQAATPPTTTDLLDVFSTILLLMKLSKLQSDKDSGNQNKLYERFLLNGCI